MPVVLFYYLIRGRERERGVVTFGLLSLSFMLFALVIGLFRSSTIGDWFMD